MSSGFRSSSSRFVLSLDRFSPSCFAELIPIFFEHLTRLTGHKEVDVFMFALGGDTPAAFGVS